MPKSARMITPSQISERLALRTGVDFDCANYVLSFL
jgi:hypothetical protein